MKKLLIIINLFFCLSSFGQDVIYERTYKQVLKSKDQHQGSFAWKMKKASEINAISEEVSTAKISTDDWLPAIVPGTVLNSLVFNEIYPEPYFGLNNKLSSNKIPDLATVGRDFYTYWFRTEFTTPQSEYKNKKTWMQVDGINYRAEIWLNV